MSEKDEWIRIHDLLQEVMERMVYSKGASGFIAMHYFGDAALLRKQCIKILNTLDRLEKKDAGYIRE